MTIIKRQDLPFNRSELCIQLKYCIILDGLGMFYSSLPKSQETLVTLRTVFGQGISAGMGNSYFVPGGIIF